MTEKLVIKQHDTNEPRKSVMTEEEMRLIAKLLKDVKYSVFLSLDHTKAYTGAVVINFTLATMDFTNLDLFLNFGGSSITQFTINSTFYSDIVTSRHVWQDNKIYLHKKALKLGHNEILIKFENVYTKVERGFSRVVDTDGLIYCYSNSEPFGIFNIFPCFDVISIRADFQLRVIAPAAWTVISNEAPLSVSLVNYAETWNVEDLSIPIDDLLKEVEIKSALDAKSIVEDSKLHNDTRLLWKFKTISNICSYLFAVFAGPFAKVSFPDDKRKFSHNYYVRESLRPFIEKQSKDIHFIVETSLECLEDVFGVKYPFSKLDHIFCPEFFSTGMENPGAISLCDEEFLFRSEPTPAQLYRQAFIIIHELVHMWLGDLLSIEWLSEVWVKESLASYFATYCFEYCPKLQPLFPDAWYRFALYKGKALEDDLDPSLSHPIADVHTADTKIGISRNFDLIVYHKGSGVFKQIFEIIGKEFIKPIMQNFVSKNAGKVITRKNLYESFQEVLREAKKEELMSEIHQWLDVKGTDRLHVTKKQDEEGKFVIGFRLDRHGSTSNRTHHMRVLIITKEDQQKIHPLKLVKGSDNTSISLEEEPKAVLPNYYDDDFIIPVLDEITIQYFVQNQAEIKDKLLIKSFWFNIYQMVAADELKLELFYDYVSKGIELEIQYDSIGKEYLVEEFAIEKLFYFIGRKCDFKKANVKALNFTNSYLKHIEAATEIKSVYVVMVRRIIEVYAKHLCSVKELLSLYHAEKDNVFQMIFKGDPSLKFELLKEGYFRGETKMVELSHLIENDHTEGYELKQRFITCVKIFGGAGRELNLKDIVKLAEKLREKEWLEVMRWKYQLSRHAWMNNTDSYYFPEYKDLYEELVLSVPKMLNETQIEMFEEELYPWFLSSKPSS